jgi:CRP-like cAMP-binding protein
MNGRMADFAGIAAESWGKLLKTFEKEGLISLHEKDIEVIKHHSLAEISKRG